MLNIVLYEPEIPHNTGAIARTCVLTHSKLHLIKPLGFSIDDKHLKRAGLDYWPLLEMEVYENYKDFIDKNKDKTIYYSTTKTSNIYTDVKFKDGDFIMFGPETRGIPESILDKNSENCIRIPMIKELKRSLNLANSANIVLFEALRQVGFYDLV
ncbi:tRNA (uridine(34)/cytosine(34)/5-carboxymethylaminomethyluridine(34)-2'-O)-methyltransferase TrmL [Peptoniphilus obesi]|uniref:tRNA (uridine(34)/cytosine(34)/5- carboxymethylaminomethyluridine(34)-2'-O)- methyltransferase TrmL n=1 Tax=Peptoniphilus obesi TaxID=1472765 RepID=UPI0004B0A769|nr:tRNA (uridine(34)/cytosine(34)/5-carboxymethylaminomethyluridine(34)-2'-O)-methyltransferase TrmL [Peptoniphilus obesi]